MKIQGGIYGALVLCLLFSGPGFSQAGGEGKIKNYCGTKVPSQVWEEQFQRLLQEKKDKNTLGKPQTPVYTIPVIIHVIHGGEAIGTFPNLAQAQLNSQINVLNTDLAGIGYNSGSYPAQAFVSWCSSQGLSTASIDAFGRVKIANCFVQFCLATKDTLGNTLAEPGIERINYVSRGWPNPAGIDSVNAFQALLNNTIKPQTIWNVSKYLNIWVTNEKISAMGLLGFATFPLLTSLAGISQSFGTSQTDGIWCYAGAFGTANEFPSGQYHSGYERGRTCTHEIGHYLGLRHIWGDGNCLSDYCDDTPGASDKNFYTPTYPLKSGSCSDNSPDGEMFMNFMDYTNDDFKYMYTEDQAARMQTAMAESPYRKFLGTHNLCSVPEIAANSQFLAPLRTCGALAPVTLSNQSTGIPVPNYTWSASGGASFYPGNNSDMVFVSFPAAGIYTITLAANNGTNSISSKTITVKPLPNLNITRSPEIECLGELVTLKASGGRWYNWLPDSTSGFTYTYVCSALNTITCTAIAFGNCRTTSVITSAGTQCTGIEALKSSAVLSVFPNPATTEINLQLSSESIGKVEITDINGSVLIQQDILPGRKELKIDTEILDVGFYVLRIMMVGRPTQTTKFIKN